MEFFIPGLVLFLISIGISFAIVPKFTPLIAAVLSIVFLTFGVYQHYKMFAYEYRLSTWQDNLKMYAPAIMIGATILFVIYAILALFTKGAVPVPPMPNVPSINEATNQITNSLNKIANTVTGNNIINNANQNKANNNKGNNNKANESSQENGNKGNQNNISRSLLEVI
jgi:hypothetical protein